MPERNHHVLFIDDEDGTSKSLLRDLLAPHGLDFRILHPEEVQQADIDRAKVVVIDYFLSEWEERDALPSLARAPRNGLAVAATLRSTQLPELSDRRPGQYPRRPIAFALWSGHLSQASFHLPDVVLPHAFSRENNLEWAFRRTELVTAQGAQKLADLCLAVDAAELWTSHVDGIDQLRSFLALTAEFSGTWYEEAVEAVLACRPPLRELATSTHGMALVRWMLHRIVPYPTFLMSEQEVVVRLSIAGNIRDFSKLEEALTPLRYRGNLSNFSGPRWWRVGVEEWLYETTSGLSSNASAIRAAMASLGAEIKHLAARPVLTLGADMSYESEPSDVDDVVRIQPEDWPPYAEPAYARIDLALMDEDVRKMVDPVDKDILERRIL